MGNIDTSTIPDCPSMPPRQFSTRIPNIKHKLEKRIPNIIFQALKLINHFTIAAESMCDT